MLYKPDRPSLADVANKIGGDWLVSGLTDLARFVRAETGEPKDNFHLDLAMMHHAEFLEFWLQAYGYAEDKFGVEYPDFIDDLSTNLSQLVELLRANLEPPKSGRPVDWPKRLCALVVIEARRLCHREADPRSQDMLKAYGEYWLAYGREWPDNIYEDEYWQRAAEWAASTGGDWVRERLLRAKPTPK